MTVMNAIEHSRFLEIIEQYEEEAVDDHCGNCRRFEEVIDRKCVGCLKAPFVRAVSEYMKLMEEAEF